MFVKKLSIRGRLATVTSRSRRSVVITCDGFTASLRELELLALRKKGKSANEMAQELDIDCHYVSNVLWNVRCRNSNIADVEDDNVHHWQVSRKAEALELIHPLALEGLSTILSGWNSVRDRAKR